MMGEQGAPHRIVCGIDEAGLGPLLGPLTLGYSAFRLPAGRATLWQRLHGAVARDPARDALRVIVADSKVVFTRNPRGRRRLETTALSFLASTAEDAAPRSGRELLRAAPTGLAPKSAELERHPWYREMPDELPLWVPAAVLERRRAALRAALERTSIELLEAGVRAVPAGELNASFERTASKGLTLWEKSAGLIAHLWRRYGREGLTLDVDRHGGRMHYRDLLVDEFPDVRIDIVREEKEVSAYDVQEGSASSGRKMHIRFSERADDHSFPVALGSCLAKYAREVVMEAFNAYFAGLQVDLRPTAGYTTDGRRWLAEAAPALDRAGPLENVLVRRR